MEQGSNGAQTGTVAVKRGLAQMLKGGVIMDVVTPEHARIAQEAGAVAVMALERIPADIRAAGGVARMSNIDLIADIMDAVTIPVMAKVRIGHFAEAQVLGRAWASTTSTSRKCSRPPTTSITSTSSPSRCRSYAVRGILGEALAAHRRRRGDDSQQGRSGQRQYRRSGAAHARHPRRDRRAVGRCRPRNSSRGRATSARRSNSCAKSRAKSGSPSCSSAPAESRRRPTPRLMMQLGAEGIFVGSGIFKSNDPKTFARAIVDATTHFERARDRARSLPPHR